MVLKEAIEYGESLSEKEKAVLNAYISAGWIPRFSLEPKQFSEGLAIRIMFFRGENAVFTKNAFESAYKGKANDLTGKIHFIPFERAKEIKTIETSLEILVKESMRKNPVQMIGYALSLAAGENAPNNVADFFSKKYGKALGYEPYTTKARTLVEHTLGVALTVSKAASKSKAKAAGL